MWLLRVVYLILFVEVEWLFITEYIDVPIDATTIFI